MTGEWWGVMRQSKHSPDLLLVERMTLFEQGAQIVEGKAHRILVRVDTFGEVARLPQSSLQEDQMSSQFVPLLFPCRLSPLRHGAKLLRWMQTAPVRRVSETVLQVGQDASVDLDAFAALVNQRKSSWEKRGIEVEFRPPGRSADWPKPSAAIRCETSEKLAELVVWTSGEAELTTFSRDLDPSEYPSVRHYELTETELSGCLDDMAEYLLTDG